MSRRLNFINNAITLTLTFVALVLATLFVNSRVAYYGFAKMICMFIVGAIVGGFISVFLHELGHLIGAKSSGFAVLSFRVWFLQWRKNKTKKSNKFVFEFVLPSSSAGHTEIVPIGKENLAKRYIKATSLGIWFSLITIALGVVPIFLKFLPAWALCMWIALIPVGVYSLLDNGLPMLNEGVKNDGALVVGLKKMDDSSKVLVNLLAIQSELFSGKTPCEIDADLYFDLPQLPEDDVNYLLILNARYNYYLDKEDYAEAKATTSRLLGLEDYALKEHICVVKADALYNACTFDFNAERADDLTYELDRYLNNVNTATNIRVKMAYLLNVSKETEAIDIFYKKGIKEANKCQISGLGKFELKLIERLYAKR